jgi:hypothetical protein
MVGSGADDDGEALPGLVGRTVAGTSMSPAPRAAAVRVTVATAAASTNGRRRRRI